MKNLKELIWDYAGQFLAAKNSAQDEKIAPKTKK
jgi:hypothetical protein